MTVKELKVIYPGKRIMASVFYDPQREDITDDPDFTDKQCMNAAVDGDMVLVNVDLNFNWFVKNCI